ncbi:helix-turn-helix domain-containing protein, partial [Candidatus Bathyarchaeota archaeon]|nr:helix-turn-helix domain-containing protein [Candidatus Bathyarchaeota archaeon]
AIIDLGSLPYGLGTIEGKAYLDFDPGDLTVSYLLGLPDLEEPEPDPDQVAAEATISEAGDFITEKIGDGITLTAPEATLTEAEALYSQEDYLGAKAKADQALALAGELVQLYGSASSAIDDAEAAISDAQDADRTIGLSDAEAMLEAAVDDFNGGSYVDAVAAAGQAKQLAVASTEPQGSSNLLYIGVAVVMVAAVGGYLFMQKNKNESQNPSFSNTLINLDGILSEHPDLRTGDKEVLRFLSENNGEAFASQIRDRFDMPRSTAWRLIHRLEDLEIVEETKVGNQSLIKIRSDYRA